MSCGPRSQRYRLLANLGRLINDSLDVRQVFGRAAEEVHQLLGCDRVSLVLVEPQDRTRRGFAVEFGDRAREVEIPVQTLADSAAEWVLANRQARIARHLDQARPFAEDRKLHARGAYRAYVYLPLVCRDGVVGIWGLATQPRRRAGRLGPGALARAVERAGNRSRQCGRV